MQIPTAIQHILNTLKQNGHEAYLVGGCVRDHLLSRQQSDFDIATSARPEEVMHLFTKTIPTGVKHGTVTVIHHSVRCEVTTYRVDGAYDGRRPQSVTFTRSIEADLSRRDFTINAIAYDGMQFVDPFAGKQDIEAALIRAVGDPSTRFQEDALRMLRAVRFAAQLGFEIEASTKAAIKQYVHLLEKVSTERIRDELDKIITSAHVGKGILLLKELGLLSLILPIVDALDEEQLAQTICLLEHTDNDPIIRRTALLYYIPLKPEAVLRQLKYDRKTIRVASALLQFSKQARQINTTLELKKCLSVLGKESIYKWLQLLQALNICDPHINKTNGTFEQLKQHIDTIIANDEPLQIQDLAVDGNDLLQIGYSEGKIIGELLQAMQQFVWLYPEMNQKQILLEEILLKYPTKKALEDGNE